MAFDQTSLPKDLRPINVVRTVTEDPQITVATTTGRHLEGVVSSPAHEVGSPGPVPVFYPATVSDAGFVVAGHVNQFPGVTAWCPRPPGPLGHVGVNAVNGFGYSPNFCNRVVTHAAGQFSSEMIGGVGSNQGLCNRDIPNGNVRPNTDVLTMNYCNLSLGNQNSGNAAQIRGEEGGDDSVSRKKVKFMCSFGGKILPRPSDGMLRYVGGQTRIISVRRDVSFSELMQKFVDAYGQPMVIKYQLPGEDLDALVSISCPDDLDNMMEEYEKLIERSSDGSAKLRVFLFSASEFDPSEIVQFNHLQDNGQRYVEAVNGVTDVFSAGITRKESIASGTSTQNSEFSGTEGFDRCVLSPREDMVFSNDNTPRTVPMDASCTTFTASAGIPTVKLDPPEPEVMMSENPVPLTIQQQQLGHELQKARILQSTHLQQGYVDRPNESSRQPEFVNSPPQAGFPISHLLGVAGPAFTQQPFNENAMNLPSSHQFFSPVHMTMTPSSHHVGVRPVVIQPVVPRQESRFDYPDNSNNLGVARVVQSSVDHSYNAACYGQIPSGVLSEGYGWHQVAPSNNIILSDGISPHPQVIAPEKLKRLEDCHMCQKALPHAHSDSIAYERNDNNGNSAPISRSVYHSLYPDDAMGIGQVNKFMGQPRVTSNLTHQVGIPHPETGKFSHDTETQIERERSALHNDGVGAAQIQAERPVQATFEEQSNETQGVFQMVNNANPREIGIENLHICSSEIYPNGEIHMPPTDRKQEEEKVRNRPEQSGGTDLFSDTTLGQAPYHGKNYEKPTEIPSKTRVEVPSMYDSRPTHSNGLLQSPFLVNAGLYPPNAVGVQQVSSVESCHAAGREPLVDGKNDKSGSHAKVFGTDSQVFPLNANLPSFNLPSLTSSDGVGDVQDSSNSLLRDQDTWIFQHDINLPNPVEVQTRKEALKGHDRSENCYAVCENKNSENPLHDEMLQSLSNLNKDFSSKGLEEERIKQELQNVAEGVVASVLDSPAPSYSGLPAQTDESTSDANQEEVSSGDVDNQHITHLEDMRTKLPERLNFGFPVSERLGRLQIIKDSDLEELRELGSGMFGTVYHGKWRGTDVAIKRINDRCFAGKPSEQERMIDDFWNEAIKLADLHHPNVVAFYGVVLDSPGGSVATVTEFMVNGSLRNTLQLSIRNIDKRKRLLIAMDVAFGMEYLHGKNIVHFDLKSDNLLVNLRDPHRPICKVGDLGLSKVKCQTLISGGVRGTLPWMAPELLNGSSSLVSEKVDVFSFGIVMWELLTGEEPYADLHYGVIIGGIVSNSLRPSVPESCEQDWKCLMERCWSAEPSERPNFTEIANELRSMAAKLSTKGQVSSQPQP